MSCVGVRTLCALVVAGLFGAVAARAAAQEPTTIQGQVTNEAGQPLASVSVFIEALSLGTLTSDEGRYQLIVPAARAQQQQVQLSASLIGYQTQSEQVTIAPGVVTQDFVMIEDPLRLEEVVVTGQGTQTTRERLGVTVTSVDAEEIINSQESNVIEALAGQAPGVQVTTSSGEPGAGSYIKIRGANTIVGSTQPLIVVDGIAINNESYQIEDDVAGTVIPNRAIDINPNDIASIEILKGPAAGAIYGSRAASGVVLITTRSGQPGANRVSWETTFGLDEVNQNQPLQFGYARGLDGTAFSGLPAEELSGWFCFWFGECELSQSDAVAFAGSLRGQDLDPNFSGSWGLPMQCAETDPATGKITSMSGCTEGEDFFDHGDELFRTGRSLESNLTMSGGTETTTYYMSVGHLDHLGYIDGNSEYNRTAARLKGSHSFTPTFTLSGNFAYTNSEGDMIQQGSNISGLLLGSLRTPPSYNNLPYIDPESGLHQSYRCNASAPDACAGGSFFDITASRGYDNPFWVAREIPNTTDVARTIGSIEVDYQPLAWLNVNYLLGADITDDNQLRVFPKSSSGFPEGQVIRGNFTQKIFDTNLILTATRDFTDFVSGSLALGANLNQDTYKQYIVTGQKLILGTDQLDFSVTRIPDEEYTRTRTAGFYAQTNLDLWDQLFLTGALRLDGSSTFGEDSGNWFVYPKFSAAWNFTDMPGWRQNNILNFGKLRFAYGVTGKQPPAYTNVTGFATGTLTDGWLTPSGLETIYQGFEGVVQQLTQGNPGIEPERTTGFDVGVDLSMFNNRVNLGLTYYNEDTEDVILDVPVPPSTGFLARWDNAAAISNEGVEATLGIRAIEQENLALDFDLQWAMNESCVEDIAGAEFISLGGFTGSLVGLFRPDTTETGKITNCYEYNTFYGVDFVRFGNGVVLEGVGSIDEAFPDAPAGALYIGEDGLPLQDGTQRPFGNANPDWTAGIRTTLNLWQRLTLSALVDINEGSRMWNGTKGAIQFFGTHAATADFHGIGKEVVFGESYLENEEVAGPGAGTPVMLNWVNWFQGGIGSGFTGPFTQFVEDASFVKLRDVSVGLTIDREWFAPLTNLGFSSADLMIVGRNLKTWTDYTGLDPETNLLGQDAGQGLEYFNNPRVRSWIFSVTLNR